MRLACPDELHLIRSELRECQLPAVISDRVTPFSLQYFLLVLQLSFPGLILNLVQILNTKRYLIVESPRNTPSGVSRLGQNRNTYVLYTTVYLVIFLSKTPYIHRICMELVNPTCDVMRCICRTYFLLGLGVGQNHTYIYAVYIRYF